jgi:hypothetical protein
LAVVGLAFIFFPFGILSCGRGLGDTLKSISTVRVRFADALAAKEGAEEVVVMNRARDSNPSFAMLMPVKST